MSSEKKESFPFFPTSAIALALAGLVYVLYQPPLESVRPGATNLTGLETREEERVQARLWQDPFLAVTDHRKGEKDHAFELMVDLHAGKPLRIEAKIDLDGHHHITRLTQESNTMGEHLVMMAMTDGSPSAEGHEQRLRDRNAVLSALGVACFVPSDPEHIGYFNWAPPSSLENGAQSKENYLTFVPYEWLDYRKLRVCDEKKADEKEAIYEKKLLTKRVLVLWFREDDLGDHPLKTLSDVWAQLINGVAEKPSLVILGPRSSSGLRTMVEGVLNQSKDQSGALFKEIPNDSERRRNHKVNLWSPWATLDDDLLVYSSSKLIEEKNKCALGVENYTPEQSSECVKKIFAEENVNLLRTIPSDQKLVRALLEELRKRNIKDFNKDRRIAIVSEWDTLYGRSLPLELRSAICENQSTPKCASHMKALGYFVNHPEKDEESGVLRYSYLRGVDGKVPGRDQEQASRKGKDREPSTTKEFLRSIELGEMERPVGESQLDNIRRLASVIRERDNRLKSECDFKVILFNKCGGIEAIGVTGSDVYDKLLVLQALRQALPEKVFFTTDLDARYTDPEQVKWTRNLIVASHFGLRLEEQIQRDVPPFRDSYQTSAFYAVLRAMGLLHCSSDGGTAGPCGDSELKSSLDQSLVYDPKLTVRLYEIGNKDAVPIGRYQDRDYDERKRFLHEFLPPPVGWTGLIQVIAYLVLGVTFALGLLCLTTSLYSSVKPWAEKNKGSLLLGLVGAVKVVILICWLLVTQGTSGEPVVALTKGVSIWPTEGIRLLVVLLTGLVLFNSRSRINTSPSNMFSKDISGHLNGTQQGPPLSWVYFSGRATSPKGWKEIVLIGGGRHFRQVSSPDQVNPKGLWEKYRKVGSFRDRMIRSTIFVALFYVLGVVLMFGIDKGFPPQSPCRGQSACVADFVMTMVLSVPCLLILIAYVFDATRLSRLMIEQLNSSDTDWGWETLDPEKMMPFGYGLKAESDWWDVRFVAEHTRSISYLVYVPFVALLLIMLARNPIFDAWHHSYGLLIIFVLSSSMCLISTFLLSRAAEKSRKQALTNLRGYLTMVIGWNKDLEEFIRYRIEEVENIKEGAYVPFLERPEVRAFGLLAATYLHLYLSP